MIGAIKNSHFWRAKCPSRRQSRGLASPRERRRTLGGSCNLRFPLCRRTPARSDRRRTCCSGITSTRGSRRAPLLVSWALTVGRSTAGARRGELDRDLNRPPRYGPCPPRPFRNAPGKARAGRLRGIPLPVGEALRTARRAGPPLPRTAMNLNQGGGETTGSHRRPEARHPPAGTSSIAGGGTLSVSHL